MIMDRLWGLMLIFTIVSANRSGSKGRLAPVDFPCNRSIDVGEDLTSPFNVAALQGKPWTCWYQLKPVNSNAKDVVVVVRFKRFKWGELVNATTCGGAYLQIFDGDLTPNAGKFCGEIERSRSYMSETPHLRLLFHTDNLTSQTYFALDTREEQQFRLHPRYGQHPALYPNRRGEPVGATGCDRIFTDCRLQTCYVQSPAYPGVYPRNLKCRYHISTRQPYIKLFTENEEFSVDGQRCENLLMCSLRSVGAQECPYDYIRVYDGSTDAAPVIGTFCGVGRFPYSIIGTGSELLVEFVSSAAGPLLNSGFHFNVDNWPGSMSPVGLASKSGRCDYVLTSAALEAAGDKEGLFLSPAHWYPPGTVCTYLIQGKEGQQIRMYFPSFRISKPVAPIRPPTRDCSESLTIYDSNGPDGYHLIKTFCDTFSRPWEKHDFVSTGNALFVRFISLTGSYSGSALHFWAHYDFHNATHWATPIPDTECDEKVLATKRLSGELGAPLNTLLYKRAPNMPPLVCTTRLVSHVRIYRRILITGLQLNLKSPPSASKNANNPLCRDNGTDFLHISETSLDPTMQMIVLGVNSSFKSFALCKANQENWPLPLTIITGGQTMELQLQIDSRLSTGHYFKTPLPLYKLEYHFAHPPLCGPAFLAPTYMGTMHFPMRPVETRDASLVCVWEWRVDPQWHTQYPIFEFTIEQLQLGQGYCDRESLEVYDAASALPLWRLCRGDASKLSFEALEGIQPLAQKKANPPRSKNKTETLTTKAAMYVEERTHPGIGFEPTMAPTMTPSSTMETVTTPSVNEPVPLPPPLIFTAKELPSKLFVILKTKQPRAAALRLSWKRIDIDMTSEKNKEPITAALVQDEPGALTWVWTEGVLVCSVFLVVILVAVWKKRRLAAANDL